ncbi:MAG: response regulator [Rickettsiales bacterium]|nr:response regulator [Rickettsiales bacterium]
MSEVFRKCKILIIDDDSLFRSYALQAVKGFRSFTAQTGDEGLKIFKEEKPDITFLDIGLPDADGQELLKEIKTIKPNAFIVMMTGNNTQKDVQQAMQNGASGYIIKPFNVQQVKKFVAHYIKVNAKKFTQ